MTANNFNIPLLCSYITCEDTMTKATYKQKHFIWGLQFQSSRAPGQHSRGHDSRQVGMGLQQ